MDLHLHIISAHEFVNVNAQGTLDKCAPIAILSNIVRESPSGNDILIDLRKVESLNINPDEIEEPVIYMINHLKTFRYKIAIIGFREKAAYPGYFEM